jgi:hypothetical protein
MFERFYPDFRFNSISDINADFFSENNINFAVLDIDNTLVSYKTQKADSRAKSFLDMLTKSGIKYAFVSNNHRKRVELFASDFGAHFVSSALKPFALGVKYAMKKMGADKEETVLIGDQVFTDVYAGKRAGIKTIMVNPIDVKETPFFGFKRYFERIVLKNYKG